jgi:acetyl esterase/lipase
MNIETSREPPKRVARGRWAAAFGLCLAVPALWAAKPLPPSPAVAVYPNLSYAENANPRQALDLYLPKDRTPGVRLPVVVYIHGGGWYQGGKEAGQPWLQPLVETGAYAGVAINYRLSGEAVWPAQIHDCKAVMRWIRAQADRYGFEPDRIGVAGASAGGTLATLLGVSGGVQELEGEVGPHLGMSSRVSCVVNLFGRMNFLAEPESARAAPTHAKALAERLTRLFGGTVEEKAAVARVASPVNHVTPGDPPVFTIHGTGDPTVPFAQAMELDAALKRAGVSHLLLVMSGFGHGFQNAEANGRARQFLDLHLRGVATKISLEPIVAPKKK